MTEFELLAMLAAKAPKRIPDWFNHVKPEEPKQPAPVASRGYDNVTAEMLRSWVVDPCWDLEPEHEAFAQEWNDYWELQADWRIENAKAQYFQWRIFFAKQVIKTLNEQK